MSDVPEEWVDEIEWEFPEVMMEELPQGLIEDQI